MVSPVPIKTPCTLVGDNSVQKKSLAGSIVGTGMSVPEKIVPNDYFVEQCGLDTSDEWIRERIGIIERRFAEPEQTAVQFATGAAREALQNGGCAAQEVDLILVATSTPDYAMPSTACLIQQELGADNACAFDINSACAGFAIAVDIAIRYLQTGAQNILIVGVDLGSRIVDMQDRNTCVFFGDGAGAVLLSSQGSGEVLASQTASAGDADPLQVPTGKKMSMDGRAIWGFAVDIIPRTIRELCAAACISVDQLDLIVPHQANRNILCQAAEALEVPVEKFVINIQNYGNTMAASIPIALHEAMQKGVPAGTRMAIIGFGAGLTWGGTLFQV